ncbi:MAG: phage tail sheath family protein [Xenococcaceae cyanobacterium]
MPTYLTPGVYIEEISAGARPIEAVGTSTAGFVGVATNINAHQHKAIAIGSWSQFCSEFAVSDNSTSNSTFLSQAVYGFFLNGGSRCYVVNVGQDNQLTGNGSGREGLALLEEIDEIAIVAAPGFSDPASHEALLAHCEELKNRVAILDPPQVVANIDLLKQVGTAAATTPTLPQEGEETRERIGTETATGLRPRQSEGGYGAFYFPWITVVDVLSPKGDRINVPPSGHLAGIYARTDATRGVHKAPANEPIRGALDVTYRVTHAEQETLNQNGVNCIRYFGMEGIRVWGARTVAASSSEWRYLNVRRLFNTIEASIARGTRWVVFEPNDVPLWKAIRRDVSAFLTLIWRQGALMGQTPEEAFFVQCNAQTNPPEVVDAGQVVIVIGIAPVKPAEFVIFRISQGAGATTQVETPSAMR